MEAKQYVDGGETIRRWRRNDGSIGPVPYVGQTESSPTFGHCFGNLGALLREPWGIKRRCVKNEGSALRAKIFQSVYQLLDL